MAQLTPRAKRCRATKAKRYSIGMVTAAGTLLSWRPAVSLTNRHTIARFTCSKCGKEKEQRMDAFLDANSSCGCLAQQNRDRMIETVIAAVPENVQESIAKELELGNDSAGKIAVHFQLFGKFARYAMAKMRRRWAESEWLRLGRQKMEQIWRSVLDKGVHWTAKRFFHGMTATVKVAIRWVRLNSPIYSQLSPQAAYPAPERVR